MRLKSCRNRINRAGKAKACHESNRERITVEKRRSEKEMPMPTQCHRLRHPRCIGIEYNYTLVYRKREDKKNKWASKYQIENKTAMPDQTEEY